MAGRHLGQSAWVWAIPFLSGCLGGGDDLAGLADSAPSTDSTHPADDAANAGLFRYPLESPVAATIWANDTFPSCVVITCGVQTQEVDITAAVPRQVPTRIRAEVTYETDPLTIASLYLSIDAEGAMVYHSGSTGATQSQAGGGSAAQAVLQAGAGSIVVRLERHVAYVGSETPYTLRIDVVADPGATPGGVPVAVELEPGRNLTLEVANATEPFVLAVYGPKDNLFSRLEGAGPEFVVEVPEDARPGIYVVVLSALELEVRLRDAGTDGRPLRALALEKYVGEVRDLVGNGAEEWTFELPRTPLRIGLTASTQLPSAGPIDWRGSVRVDSEGGTVIDGAISLGCGPGGYCVGQSLSVSSGLAHPLLGPGRYTARYAPENAQAVSVAESGLWYVR